MTSYPELLGSITEKSVWVVPTYQRGYSWKKNHIEELLKDIELCELGHNPPTLHHFIGSFLGKKMADRIELEEGFLQKYTLSDGQQRMTTIQLIFRELKERMDEEGATQQELNIVGTKIHYTPQGGGPELRLNFEEPSRQNFWEDIMDGVAPPTHLASERRIADSRDQIREYFEGKDLGELNEFRGKILKCTAALMVDYSQTLDRDQLSLNEHTIFATLNSRGLRVAPFDMIKNLGLMIRESNPGLFGGGFNPERVWKDCLTILDERNCEDKETDMIVQYTKVFRNQKLVPNDAYEKGFYKLFHDLQFHIAAPDPDDDAKADLLKAYFGDLVEFTTAYCEINTWNIHYPPRAGRRKRGLIDKGNLLIEDVISLRAQNRAKVFSNLLICSKEKFSEADFNSICELTGNVSFRIYSYKGKRTDKWDSEILDAANNVWNGRWTSAQVRTFLCDLLCNADSEASMSDFIHRIFYTINTRDVWSDWSQLTYFLFEYEQRHNPAWVANRETYRNKRISIEHIIPRAFMREPYWNGQFPNEAEGDRIKKRLGNLVLTGDNSAYWIHPYPRKRNGNPVGTPPYYGHVDSLKGEQIVAAIGPLEWKQLEIATREVLLAWFAFNRWKTDCECDAVAVFNMPDPWYQMYAGIGLINIKDRLEEIQENGEIEIDLDDIIHRIDALIAEEEE